MNADESKACKESAHALSAAKTGAKLGEFCLPCLVFDMEELRAELNDAEVLIIALKARLLGANNRVAYLESLLRECASAVGRAGI